MSHAQDEHTDTISSTQPSIAIEINTATRKLHTELNRLIVDRLPLALPPHTKSPARYAIGLNRFAAIYYAIEKEFDLLAQRNTNNDKDDDEHKRAVAIWLENLIPDGLHRTQRFSDDIVALQTRTCCQLATHSSIEKEQTRLHSIVEARPHVLVAYVWIMYMAIFSGGRYIRQQLASPGETFWIKSDGRPLEKGSSSLPGFTFLSFSDANDGEDLKSAFKHRLADADGLLSEGERLEIVEESQVLFQHCVDIIREIDREVLWYESAGAIRIALAFLVLALFWLSWILLPRELSFKS